MLDNVKSSGVLASTYLETDSQLTGRQMFRNDKKQVKVISTIAHESRLYRTLQLNVRKSRNLKSPKPRRSGEIYLGIPSVLQCILEYLFHDRILIYGSNF